ncbi:MAG: hypothetical protein JWM11_96 [Planctomycetaceae bacterium]|nr:hypothetical protein [Planctomycetaceae bacterium]
MEAMPKAGMTSAKDDGVFKICVVILRICMTKSHIEACQKRNQKLKQDIVDGKVTIVNVTKSCSDVDNLFIDLESATERVRLEREEQQELRNRIGRESTKKADCMRTVSVLRGKLSKAKAILDSFDQTAFSPQEKQDMKDVMADA